MTYYIRPTEYTRGQEFLDGIIEGLYGKKAFNENDFEHCLEELCALFDINLPNQALTIEPKTLERRND